jgi:hypothetical protein
MSQPRRCLDLFSLRGTLLLLIVLLFPSTTDLFGARIAKDGVVELRTDIGTAYLRVVLEEEPDEPVIALLLITLKLPAPSIDYTEVAFEIFDASGKLIPSEKFARESSFVSDSDPIGICAKGTYLLRPEPGQKASSARVTWRRKIAKFPDLSPGEERLGGSSIKWPGRSNDGMNDDFLIEKPH